jgi:hypothetical protein
MRVFFELAESPAERKAEANPGEKVHCKAWHLQRRIPVRHSARSASNGTVARIASNLEWTEAFPIDTLTLKDPRTPHKST